MAEEKKKYETGWRIMLIKAICAAILVLLAEVLLNALASKAAPELVPFHNHYFSFHSYYLTSQGTGSDFSDDPSATTRFVVYFILGYIVYAVINTAMWLIPFLRKRQGKINSVLFYLMVAGAFALGFFFPPRMGVINTAEKDISITHYNYLFVPETVHIPFTDIDKIACNTARDYNGHDKEYTNYLVISLKTKSGAIVPLGEIQAGTQRGTLVDKPAAEIPPAKREIADKAVKRIEGINAVITPLDFLMFFSADNIYLLSGQFFRDIA